MNLRRNLIPGFLFRFVLIYALLIFPWPGWDDYYGGYFRDLGRMAFSRDEGKQFVRFDLHDFKHDFTTLTTRMALGNRDLMTSNGKGQGQVVDLDTRSIGWIPTALTVALVLATPIPWKRRLAALLAGLVLIHSFILFSLQAWIWNKLPDVSLAATTPFWSEVTDGLQYTLLTQMGASFSVPVLIWILVTFRRQDAIRKNN